MTARYDDRVTLTEQRIREAQSAYEAADAASKLPAWLRLQSWRRLADAHRDHVHWWYSATVAAATCTCGLLAELPPPPVHETSGHRDPRTWQPTSLLVTPAGVAVDRPSPSLWQLVCQGCGLTSDPLSRRRAVRSHGRHHFSCPISASRKDLP